MKIADNTRAMLSTTAGWAGLGVGLAGWGAKALTPSSASATAKTAIGGVTALAIAGGTFAGLAYFAPPTLVLLDFELTFPSSVASQTLAAVYAGACAAVSYALGGARGEAATGRVVRSFEPRRR